MKRKRDGQRKRSDGRPPGWKDFLQQCPDVGGAHPQETREGRVESAERLADSCEWLGGGRLVKLNREERRMKQV